MNIPFIGQKFRQLGNLFVPDPKGRSTLVYFDGFSGIIHGRKVDMLSDGSFSAILMKPFRRYFRKPGGHYVYSMNGPIIIRGRFPHFTTNEGITVYIDYDRSFWTEPVNLVERFAEQYRIERSTIEEARKKVKPLDARRITIKVEPILNGYQWRVLVNGGLNRSGTADNHTKAIRDAECWKHRILREGAMHAKLTG